MIRQGLERSDILILSGGLGPTKDDLTKEVATKACGQKLVEDEEALRRLKEYFASSHRSMTENNLKQALIPEDCDVLYNENGTAKKVVLLPGPPSELIPMFHDQVEPILKELSSEVLYSDVVKIDCMGESQVTGATNFFASSSLVAFAVTRRWTSPNLDIRSLQQKKMKH